MEYSALIGDPNVVTHLKQIDAGARAQSSHTPATNVRLWRRGQPGGWLGGERQPHFVSATPFGRARSLQVRSGRELTRHPSPTPPPSPHSASEGRS